MDVEYYIHLRSSGASFCEYCVIIFSESVEFAMDALCTLPFILVFSTRTGECRINFPLPCTDHTLFYIPILSGKLNSNFAKGKLVSKIYVRLRFLQTFYNFLVTFHEAKLALRLMYNFLLYGHDRTQLSVCNRHAFAEVCNDSVVDLVILSGNLNSNFARGNLISKIYVRLTFLQTFYDFLVTFHEAKLALRLMYNFLLYRHDRTQLSMCNIR